MQYRVYIQDGCNNFNIFSLKAGVQQFNGKNMR